MVAGAHGSPEVDVDDVDAAFSRQLARWPEVRLMGIYTLIHTLVRMLLKGTAALLVLWSTAVLLGGFVSSLRKIDFWFVTVISLLQFAGIFSYGFEDLMKDWMRRLTRQLNSIRVLNCKLFIIASPPFWIMYLLLTVVSIYGPFICALLSSVRGGDQPLKHASDYKDVDEANLMRGLDLFYCLCYYQGLLFFIWQIIDMVVLEFVLVTLSHRVGLNKELVYDYVKETRLKYRNSLASYFDGTWNFITYGAGLLDSDIPKDSLSGANILATLIGKGILIRLLLRSPRYRIQKLIGSLAWRSLDEGQMRWLAARIVEHVACDISLAHFPGALECISSLLDMSGYKDGGHEAVNFVAQLRLDKQQGKQKGHLKLLEFNMMDRIELLIKDKIEVSINSVQGINEGLILQGLRILENLALEEHNCKLICSTDALLSKIVAPVSSKNFIQDNTTNTAWSKVTDGSLKLLSKLMRSPGDTGKQVCCKVSDNSLAVKNLEEVLALEISRSSIVELQIRAIEILEQLCSGESTATTNWDRERRTTENLIRKVLYIFLTDQWMENYLINTRAMADEEIATQLGKSKKKPSKKSQQAEQALGEIKMKAAQDTATRLKEKAGEALVTLCMGGQINLSDYIIRSFTGCGEAVCYLTEMLGSENRTARCRHSAAVILKYLYIRCTTLDHGYLKETTLKKVFDVLHIQTEAQATGTSKLIDDITPPVPRYKQQLEERMLQVALLSLYTAIPDFASVVPLLVSHEDLANKLKKIVEKSRYATVSCLATVKLTCKIVMALIPHDHLDINMKKEIVDSLCQASEMMSGLESCMLFAGADHDCYGLPVKPFCSDLVKQARELLREKEQEMDLPNV